MELLTVLAKEYAKKGIENLDPSLINENPIEVLDSIEMNENSLGVQGLANQLEGLNQKNIESVRLTNEKTLESRNLELATKVHETGVPFIKQDVYFQDEGVYKNLEFPVFESFLDKNLPEHLYKESDYFHKKYLNEELRKKVESDSKFKEQFNDRQLEQIEFGKRPEGFTWHHHQDLGKMQLVDSRIHGAIKHTGGREIWGGGHR